jgi:radical SAM superfamily enzyme YgiQ (UPF0313 family)
MTELLLAAMTLFFTGMTVWNGVHHTLRNRDAVLRDGNVSPFVIPLLFFVVPSAVTSLLFAGGTVAGYLRALTAPGAGVLVYLAVMTGVLAALQIRYRRELAAFDHRQKGFSALPGPRLLLINPRNGERSGLTETGHSKFPPLGLGILAALTPGHWSVRILDENWESWEFTDADLVGITAFTAAAPRAYAIAAEYRKRGIPVVMGGIHASMNAEEALRYADAVVTGEGESVWPAVLADFEAGSLQPLYKGGQSSLENAPVPRRELFNPRYMFATVQTSRGCPMDCDFCSVTPFNGKKYRQRPVGEVLEELAAIPQRNIFFIDDNILGYGKAAEERALSLFQGMTERKLDKSWFCQASINFGGNPEVLKQARKSGCRMVFLGLEAIDPDELKTMNKSLNARTGYRPALTAINRAGIAVLGAFIFGTDSDTPEAMMRKTRFILDNPVDVIQVTALTPLPGTRLFERMKGEGRLLHTVFPADWVRYDMGEMLFHPALLGKDEYNRAGDRCRKILYSRWTLLIKFLATWRRTGSLETAFWALGSNQVYRRATFTVPRSVKVPLAL